MATQKDVDTLKAEFQDLLTEFAAGDHPYCPSAQGFGSRVSIEAKINRYMVGEKHARFAWANVVRLADWYFRNSVFTSLAESSSRLLPLSRSALGYYYAAVLGDAIGHLVQDKSPYWSWSLEAGPALGLNMFMGWFDKCESITRVYLKSLISHDEQLLVGHGVSSCKSTWFLLELMCDYLGADFSRDNVDYPEEMSPYDLVLGDWKTESLVDVARYVEILADYHLEQSRFNSSDGDTYEFSQMEWWLFPYEVFAFLKLREQVGLRIPEEFDHPLIQRSVFPLYCGRVDVPDFPVLTAFLTKLESEHPRIIEGI